MVNSPSSQPPLLTSLRRKPPEARRAIAKMVAGVVTGAVFVGWLVVKATTFSLPTTVSSVPMEAQTAALKVGGSQIREVWNHIFQASAVLRSATSAGGSIEAQEPSQNSLQAEMPSAVDR
jgi:hypothetical protein